MSLETIKKLIWASNVYFFGSKKIAKYDFIFFYGFFATLLVALVFWLVALAVI